MKQNKNDLKIMKKKDGTDCLESDLIHFMNRSKWIYAKTMPDAPHWYLVRNHFNKQDQELFMRIVDTINEFGFKEKYKGYWYKCLEFDCWKFWSIGYSRNDPTYILNMCHLDRLGPDRIDPNSYNFIEKIKDEEEQYE